MHRQAQRQRNCGARAACGSTDWQALEVQLTRTRTILQEILVHLQEVLKNLKMARASSRFGAQAFAGEARSRAQQAAPGAHGTRFQRPQAGCGAGASATSATAGAAGSERFRARPHPGFEARTETGPGRSTRAAGFETGQSRTAAGEKARPGESWSFRTGGASSRTNATNAGGTRERARTESTFRAKPGPERETRQGFGTGQKTGAAAGPTAGQAQGQTTAGPGRVHTRTAGRSGSVFRLDRERQYRAREAARKSGMNLKCAYDILCLDYPCSVDEIKNAYRHMARLHHPDLGGDEEAMKDVNVAYELAMRFCAGPRRASTAWAV